jgi:spore coat protein H
MRMPYAVRLALMLGGLTLATPDAHAQVTEDLFAPDRLQELRLFMHANDLRQLRERYLEDTYYPADVQWGGVRVRNVGVRSRGLGSRSQTKPALMIDANRYVSGQEFAGFKSVVLDNLIQDPSFVHERLAMAFFRKMGLAAPRVSFARVFINDEYQGVYGLIESVNGSFLNRTFGDRDGYLFERKFAGAYFAQDLGTPEAYRAVFPPRTRELEPDALLYAPIRDLFHEVNQPVDGVWRERVERYIDLEQFVTYVAVETFLSEADGVLGFAGMANFYLYRPEGSERHRLIPWDKDRSFSSIDSQVLQHAEENDLFKRVLQVPELRAVYLDAVDRCAAAASDGDWLAREITAAADLVRAAAYEDPWKPYANETFDDAIAFLREFARLRPAFVREDAALERGIR